MIILNGAGRSVCDGVMRMIVKHRWTIDVRRNTLITSTNCVPKRGRTVENFVDRDDDNRDHHQACVLASQTLMQN